MTERLILKGRHGELKMEKMELQVRCGANLRAAKDLLAGLSFKPLADIDVDAALVHLTAAAGQKRQILEIEAMMNRIAKELGEQP